MEDPLSAPQPPHLRSGAPDRLKTRGRTQRAARVLETAVGEALGPVEQTYPGKNASPANEAFINKDDRHRFRLMAAHRDLWWPVLAEKALSRRQVLTMIAEANRPPVADSAGPAKASQGNTTAPSHSRQ